MLAPCQLLSLFSFVPTGTYSVCLAMHIEILHIQYKLRLVGNEVNGAQSNKDLIVQDFPASSMVVVPTVENHIATGHGRITCSLNGVSVVFSELSSTYPLKLLSPRLAHSDVAIVYVMNYGGGLVCGDRIKLQVRAEGGSRLLLLSQGSTKVFKVRSPNRASTRLGNSTDDSPLENNATTQLLDVHVAPTSAVFLLPDPVTCFRSASYTQVQRFHLSKGASMVLLDWFTSGRKSLGEEWVFSRYFSVNEVNVDGRRIAKDVMLLEEPLHDDTVVGTHWPKSRRSLSDRLKPYSCYATLIVCGPLVHGVVAQLEDKLRSLTVLVMVTPPRVLWGMTPVDDGNIFVIRVAGLETEDVKDWLRESLRPLEEVVGIDTYRKAFS